MVYQLSERVEIRVSKSMYDILDITAKKEGTTISDVVRSIIFYYFYMLDELGELNLDDMFPFSDAFEREVFLRKMLQKMSEPES